MSPARGRHSCGSSEQQCAELKILKNLRTALKLRTPLAPEKMMSGDAHVQGDGVSRGKQIVPVEVYAHQGSIKRGQPHKLMSSTWPTGAHPRCIPSTCLQALKALYSVATRCIGKILEARTGGKLADGHSRPKISSTIAHDRLRQRTAACSSHRAQA